MHRSRIYNVMKEFQDCVPSSPCGPALSDQWLSSRSGFDATAPGGLFGTQPVTNREEHPDSTGFRFDSQAEVISGSEAACCSALCLDPDSNQKGHPITESTLGQTTLRLERSSLPVAASFIEPVHPGAAQCQLEEEDLSSIVRAFIRQFSISTHRSRGQDAAIIDVDIMEIVAWNPRFAEWLIRKTEAVRHAVVAELMTYETSTTDLTDVVLPQQTFFRLNNVPIPPVDIVQLCTRPVALLHSLQSSTETSSIPISLEGVVSGMSSPSQVLYSVSQVCHGCGIEQEALTYLEHELANICSSPAACGTCGSNQIQIVPARSTYVDVVQLMVQPPSIVRCQASGHHLQEVRVLMLRSLMPRSLCSVLGSHVHVFGHAVPPSTIVYRQAYTAVTVLGNAMTPIAPQQHSREDRSLRQQSILLDVLFSGDGMGPPSAVFPALRSFLGQALGATLPATLATALLLSAVTSNAGGRQNKSASNKQLHVLMSHAAQDPLLVAILHRTADMLSPHNTALRWSGGPNSCLTTNVQGSKHEVGRSLLPEGPWMAVAGAQLLANEGILFVDSEGFKEVSKENNIQFSEALKTGRVIPQVQAGRKKSGAGQQQMEELSASAVVWGIMSIEDVCQASKRRSQEMTNCTRLFDLLLDLDQEQHYLEPNMPMTCSGCLSFAEEALLQWSERGIGSPDSTTAGAALIAIREHLVKCWKVNGDITVSAEANARMQCYFRRLRSSRWPWDQPQGDNGDMVAQPLALPAPADILSSLAKIACASAQLCGRTCADESDASVAVTMVHINLQARSAACGLPDLRPGVLRSVEDVESSSSLWTDAAMGRVDAELCSFLWPSLVE